jgi:hypothetical protein
MIFHSANNLRKEKKKRKRKEKEKEKRKKRKRKKKKEKRKKKKKKKKKKKRGHKRIEIKPHAIMVTWSIPFKHGQVLFKFDVDRVVNDLAKQFNLSQSV